MLKEKTKVYLYTRVSTAMQIDGYSLEAQKALSVAQECMETKPLRNARMEAIIRIFITMVASTAI